MAFVLNKNTFFLTKLSYRFATDFFKEEKRQLEYSNYQSRPESTFISGGKDISTVEMSLQFWLPCKTLSIQNVKHFLVWYGCKEIFISFVILTTSMDTIPKIVPVVTLK